MIQQHPHDDKRSGMIPAITTEHLTFRYETQGSPVFRDLTFSIHRGETVLFLGPSGSGKSTLMYCLNRLYPETVDGTLEGMILVHGKDISEFASGEVCRQIGTVFQDPESQFCMTRVDEEVAFGLENLSITRSDMDRRIDYALEQVGLLDCRRERIHILSGGMKQRLAVACALAAEPNILILDEPTAQLDPSSARELVKLINKLKRERNLTVLLVEHRLDEWITDVDRMYLLNSDGRLMGEGAPRACFTSFGAALAAQGIWMPTVSKLALDLQSSRIYGEAELPLNEHQLIEGLKQPGEAAAVFENQLHAPLAGDGTDSSVSGSLLSVSGLTVRYGGKSVLDQIDLQFQPGQLTAIVGMNGSGKTTLLQHLAGIGSKVSAGECRLDGRQLTEWPEHELRRHIGYVFQNPEHQFVTFNVFDEVAFGMRLQGIAEQKIQHKVERLLRESGLSGLEEANPFSLSQGQKRRLSVATMLADEQRWLLLDEPTFGQDARTSEQLMEMLRKRVLSGMSVIMISHDMDLVQQYADRVVVLAGGKVRYDGVPTQLWNQRSLLSEGGLLPPVPYRILTQITSLRRNGHAELGTA